jgi:hypothetical protein
LPGSKPGREGVAETLAHALAPHKGMKMPIHDPKEEKALSLDETLSVYARRLQLWRLCRNAECLRARACRGGLRHCTQRFADWAEAVKECGRREFAARDPNTQALRDQLAERIIRLGQTLASD